LIEAQELSYHPFMHLLTSESSWQGISVTIWRWEMENVIGCVVTDTFAQGRAHMLMLLSGGPEETLLLFISASD